MKHLLFLLAFFVHAGEGLEIPAYADTAAIVRHNGFVLEYAENMSRQNGWRFWKYERAPGD